MNENTTPRPANSGRIRRAISRVEQHLRLQRQLLWHPRLGLAGARQPVPLRRGVPGYRRSPR